MKNIFLFLIFVFGYNFNGYSQERENDGIIKISFESRPVSAYKASDNDLSQIIPGHGLTVLQVLENIVDYYSLYVDKSSNRSVYVLDSVVNYNENGLRWNVTDRVKYVLKDKNNKTYKKEFVFSDDIYSVGEIPDIHWELNDEKKKIGGLTCYKAISVDREYMLTIWYTKELPISNGPSIYQGLPGMVVWAEDYFRTTDLISINYNVSKEFFEELFNKYNVDFKGVLKKNIANERIIQLSKLQTGLSMYKRHHED